jgi:putative SOS response-associated peptidase YedK
VWTIFIGLGTTPYLLQHHLQYANLEQRPSAIRSRLIHENMPVDDAPPDEGDYAPRETYNFAPGYNGLVYRAEVPDWGAGPYDHGGRGNYESDLDGEEHDDDHNDNKHENKPSHEPSHSKKTTKANKQAQETAQTIETTDQPRKITHKDLSPEPAPATEQPQKLNDDALLQDNRTPSPQPPLLSSSSTKYKLQTMRWGLIPFWTKRNPPYGKLMHTINCRDDSLSKKGGMWSSMKSKKRCIVLAQGFYEWLKKGKEKQPYFIKRADGQLMCFAGLWDCVRYEDATEKLYTYTIITTDSNKQCSFVHDRMPVILENGSEAMRKWLDPNIYTWNKELQSLLKPFEGELELYPVAREVGKVGNNSPNFIVPVTSSENKNNIANFFTKDAKPKPTTTAAEKKRNGGESKILEKIVTANEPQHEKLPKIETVDHGGTEDNAPLPVPEKDDATKQGVKRGYVDDVPGEDVSAGELAKKPAKKTARTSASPEQTKGKAKVPAKKGGRSKNPLSNETPLPENPAGKNLRNRKITSFYGK